MASKLPNVPILDYPSPSVILDTVLVERSSNTPGTYRPLEPGAPFPKGTHDTSQLAEFGENEFLSQKGGPDDEWISRFFGRPPSTQDIANWEESFAEEANAYPIFQRRYLEKRDSYAARTKLTALPGLYRINVTAAGSGFTVPPTISFTGGTGSGAIAIAVLNNAGGIAKITLKAEGNYTVVPTVVITPVGAGSGATAVASIQPATCLLVKEDATDNAPEPYRSLYLLVTRLYRTLPGPMLIGRERSEEVRGTTLSTNTQEGASGALPVDTGVGIISSVVIPLSSVIDRRVTKSATDLPPTEVSGFWRDVGLPLLIFSISNTVYCNGGPFGKLVTNEATDFGSSQFRKHRKTVSYDFGPTAPDPDLSGSAIITRRVDYDGNIIHLHWSDVLNDALAYDEDFVFSSSGSACGWTEAYSYAATTPSATDFAAGMWVPKSFVNEKWGDCGWKSTLIEYYSAAGDPAL